MGVDREDSGPSDVTVSERAAAACCLLEGVKEVSRVVVVEVVDGGSGWGLEAILMSCRKNQRRRFPWCRLFGYRISRVVFMRSRDSFVWASFRR